MNRWLNSLPPRLQGLAAIGIGLAVVAAGLLVARMLGRQFLPVINPLSGLVLGMGLFQVITGHSRDDLANRRVPQGLMLAAVFAMAGGVFLGLEANLAFFGVRG